MNDLVVILLSALIYLPGNSSGNYLRLAIVVLAYLLVGTQNRGETENGISKIVACMIVSPLLPVPLVMITEGSVALSLVFHELTRMVYCGVLILTLSKMTIRSNTLYISSIIALIPNLMIQVLQYIGFAPVFSIIKSYYVLDESNLNHLSLAYLKGMNFRSGSIFCNPNVYMVIPIIALCVFLHKDRTKPSILNTLCIIAAAVSGILTGSRTFVVVFVVMMGLYLFRYASTGRRIIFFAIIAFAFYRYGTFLLSNSRAVNNISVDGSLGAKGYLFSQYFKNSMIMPLYWLIGSIGSYTVGTMDSEWGHIFSWYGVFGMSWYIKYYRYLWYNNYEVDFFAKIITISCGLVAITASVLQCMPVYSYVAAVAVTKMHYYRYEEYCEI